MRELAAILAAILAAGCVTIGPLPTSSFGPRTGAPTAPPRASDATVGPGETSRPTPARTDTGPTPPSTAGAIDPAMAAQIDEVIAQVPPVRELTAEADVPYEFITREQFREDLIELAFEEVPEETRAAEERLLKRLGLLADDADLEQLLTDLYGAEVAAFYRPDTKNFYIIERDEPFGASDRMFVAHEYTHALQDQHFDLEGTRIKDLSEGDAALGQLAAIEGDATLTMQLWAQANLSAQELFEVFVGSLGQLDDPTLASMPPILRRQLEFPYVEGFAFVQQVHASGGFDAVDELLRDAPESTEQILHPEKYFADEQPVHVGPPGAFATFLCFRDAYEQTMGELLMQVFLAGDESPDVTIPGLPVEWPHAEAAAGWGGDSLVMFECPASGAWAIVWRTAWDTAVDADEFRARFNELAPTFDGPSTITRGLEENMVQVVIASDDEALQGFDHPDL